MSDLGIAADLAAYLCTEGAPNPPDKLAYIRLRQQEEYSQYLSNGSGLCFNGSIDSTLLNKVYPRYFPTFSPEDKKVDLCGKYSTTNGVTFKRFMRYVWFYKLYLQHVVVRNVSWYLAGETDKLLEDYLDFTSEPITMFFEPNLTIKSFVAPVDNILLDLTLNADPWDIKEIRKRNNPWKNGGFIPKQEAIPLTEWLPRISMVCHAYALILYRIQNP